ncbi:MAG TPA: DUF1385 domain-containing protein [Solirubrobacteraceae bacterium]|nr:DUF1385 domain-containing protein [Solirubrobacteraceae bacterium]
MAENEDKLRLGGMALRNGLLVHGPGHWAAAVRRDDGSIAVASGPKPRLRGRVDAIPGVRGVLRLGEAVAVIPLVKRTLPEARLPFQDATVVAVMAATAAASVVVRRRTGGMRGEAALAVLSMAPSLVALRGGDLAAYHGVEHKAIGAYEQGSDAVDATKEHERCGSHLMAPLLAANLAGTALLRRAVDKPSPLAGAAVQLASVGAAVEVFAWSERHGDTALARALRKPGYELQRVLGTREPSGEQLEVGRAALAEILRVEGG